MSTTSISTLVAAQVRTQKDLENLRVIVKDNLSDISKLIDCFEIMHKRVMLQDDMTDTLKDMIQAVSVATGVAPNAWTMADTSTEVTNDTA